MALRSGAGATLIIEVALVKDLVPLLPIRILRSHLPIGMVVIKDQLLRSLFLRDNLQAHL